MSSNSSGSTIRLIVLIVLLGLVGFAFYNDSMNRKPEVDKLTENFYNLADSPDGPYTAEKVQAEMKMKPARTFKLGKDDKYTVEEYKLKRTIPFLSFGSIYAIYEKGDLFKVAQETPTSDSIEKATGMGSFEFVEKKADVSIGGMPTKRAEEKEEAKEEKKEEAPPAEKKDGEAEKPAEGQPKEGDGG